MPLADGHLIDADDRWPWCAGAPQLLAHGLLLERLDRVPFEPELLGNVLFRRGRLVEIFDPTLSELQHQALRLLGVPARVSAMLRC